MVIGTYVALQLGPVGPTQVQAAEPTVGNSPAPAAAKSASPDPTASAPSTVATTDSTPPPLGSRYLVSATEAAPEAKQLAADIAYTLTNYEATDDFTARLQGLNSLSGIDLLAEASTPLTYRGSWSRGEVIYPQMGGLKNGRASVMVVTRQTVGTGSDVEFSVVRTLDVRLTLGDSGWMFDSLASAGGSFEDLEGLAAADSVANDPRIEMPDSARLDILAGRVSPLLLSLMADLAEQTPYEVAVLVTGHPHNVFETDRQSDHTVGRAVDIVRIGDRMVIDDRGPDSAAFALAQWLYSRPDVAQVGSPWDLDGPESRRSFSDEVHQDHIHVAVASG
jgi:hypothetical protein